VAVRSAPSDYRERDVAGVHVVHADGELDLDTAGELCARVDAARAAGHRRLLIDLTQLRFCDSTGLRALAGAVGEIAAGAGRVVVIPPTDGAVARVFTLAGAGESLPLRPTVADGLAALRRGA
jgi:anti-sigma B factor antagonist